MKPEILTKLKKLSVKELKGEGLKAIALGDLDSVIGGCGDRWITVESMQWGVGRAIGDPVHS